MHTCRSKSKYFPFSFLSPLSSLSPLSLSLSLSSLSPSLSLSLSLSFLTLTVSPCLTLGHVIKNVLHCPTVWQGTGPEPAVCLLLSLPLLTAMSMKEEYQLLLDEFPLLWVIACRGGLSTTHDWWKLRLKREREERE